MKAQNFLKHYCRTDVWKRADWCKKKTEQYQCMLLYTSAKKWVYPYIRILSLIIRYLQKIIRIESAYYPYRIRILSVYLSVTRKHKKCYNVEKCALGGRLLAGSEWLKRLEWISQTLGVNKPFTNSRQGTLPTLLPWTWRTSARVAWCLHCETQQWLSRSRPCLTTW